MSAESAVVVDHGLLGTVEERSALADFIRDTVAPDRWDQSRHYHRGHKGGVHDGTRPLPRK